MRPHFHPQVRGSLFPRFCHPGGELQIPHFVRDDNFEVANCNRKNLLDLLPDLCTMCANFVLFLRGIPLFVNLGCIARPSEWYSFRARGLVSVALGRLTWNDESVLNFRS